MEHGDYLKTLLHEAFHSSFSLVTYRAGLKERDAILVVDAKSLYDFLGRDTGRLPADKRLGIDMRLMQHYMTESSWFLKWVCGPQQLADCLTKAAGDQEYLRWVLKHGKYQLLEDSALKEKVKKEIGDIQTKLLNTDLTSADKKKISSRKKGVKHRARVEAIRDKMNDIKPDSKPTFLQSNIVFAVCSALSMFSPLP
jgi:hypothetical protein